MSSISIYCSTFWSSTRSQRWHSNAGGGGERVLWTAVALSLCSARNPMSLASYTVTTPTRPKSRSSRRLRYVRTLLFPLTLTPDSLHFLLLESRRLMEDHLWPRFTLLGLSLGSMYLAWEAMSKFIPGLYIGELCFYPLFTAVS